MLHTFQFTLMIIRKLPHRLASPPVRLMQTHERNRF
jgi:hypothetical protein